MRKLMSPPNLLPDPLQTKTKIMSEAARMFALSGYHAVSIRDITAAIGILPGSLYIHFSSKLEIMENIMKLIESDLRDFYSMLDRLSEEASTFSQLLDNLFIECREMANPFSLHGIYCAMINQFELECCRHVYYDVYFKEGHCVMQRQLETAVRRNLAPPFDIPKTASLITNCFVTMIGFNVGYINGSYPDFDPKAWYDRQQQHILEFIGTLEK